MTAAAGLFLVVQACGGSGAESGPNAAATEADLAALCTDICERGLTCEPEYAEDSCQTECVSDNPEATLVRRDVIRGLVDCQRQLTCDDNDDLCIDRVLRELEPDFAGSPLLDLCIRVQDQCGGFSDDICAYAVIFTDDGKARLEACLNSGCESVGACIAGL